MANESYPENLIPERPDNLADALLAIADILDHCDEELGNEGDEIQRDLREVAWRINKVIEEWGPSDEDVIRYLWPLIQS